MLQEKLATTSTEELSRLLKEHGKTEKDRGIADGLLDPSNTAGDLRALTNHARNRLIALLPENFFDPEPAAPPVVDDMEKHELAKITLKRIEKSPRERLMEALGMLLGINRIERDTNGDQIDLYDEENVGWDIFRLASLAGIENHLFGPSMERIFIIWDEGMIKMIMELLEAQNIKFPAGALVRDPTKNTFRILSRQKTDEHLRARASREPSPAPQAARAASLHRKQSASAMPYEPNIIEAALLGQFCGSQIDKKKLPGKPVKPGKI